MSRSIATKDFFSRVAEAHQRPLHRRPAGRELLRLSEGGRHLRDGCVRHRGDERLELRLDLAQRRAITATGRKRLERAGLPVAAKDSIDRRRPNADELSDLLVRAPLLAEADDDAADLQGRRWSHDHRRSRPADRIKRARR